MCPSRPVPSRSILAPIRPPDTFLFKLFPAGGTHVDIWRHPNGTNPTRVRDTDTEIQVSVVYQDGKSENFSCTFNR